jgi:hypothetical protein
LFDSIKRQIDDSGEILEECGKEYVILPYGN